MLASHLHLPTAAWGGHMGHFLLSMLILSSSTPLGNIGIVSWQSVQRCARCRSLLYERSHILTTRRPLRCGPVDHKCHIYIRYVVRLQYR